MTDVAPEGVYADVKNARPDMADRLGTQTAWLIEETWSGYVHYVHETFDGWAWRTEANSLARLPFVWVPSGTGGATLTRRVPTIQFITKNVDEAKRFPDKASAEAWLVTQPGWFWHGDQFQAREHMWVWPLGGQGNTSPPSGINPNPPPL